MNVRSGKTRFVAEACVVGLLLAFGMAAAGQDRPAPASPRQQAGRQTAGDPYRYSLWKPADGIMALKAAIGHYPQTDGSTSTQPLATLVAARRLGLGYRKHVGYEGAVYGAVYGDSLKRVGQSLRNRIHFLARHNGTHGSYVNLIAGKTDLVLVARAPSKDELELAQSRNVALDVRPVALDAFVFIVNAKNPLKGLSEKQLRGIYQGGVSNWKPLGWQDKRIAAYARNRNSGSQELMEKLVMRGTPMRRAPDLMASTMGGAINRVVSDTYGIGYTVYFYQTAMLNPKKPGPKMLAVNGVFPDADTIRSGKYAYAAKVYAVIRSTPAPGTGGAAATLRDWLLSADGQAVVAESGYVPLPAPAGK